MKTYDVIIIGAGPAGSTFARLIEPKNLSVAIFDMRNLSEEYQGKGFIKSCGGMLAPDAQKFLKKNHIELPKEVYDEVQPRRVKTYDKTSGLVRKYRRNYINIDREKFDRFLQKDIKADKYYNYVVSSLKKDGDFYIVNDEYRAKILVGADGANSKVRKAFFKELKIRQYVSIQDVLEKQESKEYECFFDENIGDYYGWSLPKGSKTLVGFAIPEGKDVLEKFSKFKKFYGFNKEIIRQGTFIMRPNFFHKVSAEKGLFLIGEAGGYISPSSAEGISYAFKTAELLAASNMDYQIFKRKMRLILLNIFYKNIKSLIMYIPYIRRIVMRFSFV